MKPSSLRMLALAGLCAYLAVRLPGQVPPINPDGPPILRDWVQPAYPAEAAQARREGIVRVELVVEADGSVSRAAVVGDQDEGFNAAALAAVQQWRFKPGTEDGKPAAGAMQVRVVFSLDQLRQRQVPLFPPGQPYMPYALELTPAKPQRSIEPDYPAELEESLLPGSVDMEFEVSAEGKVEHPKVKLATHPAFVTISLRAIEQANFIPARQGPLARRSLVKYPVDFWSMGAKPAEILTANGLALVADAPRILPQPLMLIRAVYPFARLLAGEEGQAVAEFTLSVAGRPEEISVVAADYPEFGAALRAAVETWGFKPAQGDTGPVAVRMRATQAFTAAARPAERRVADLLRPGGGGVTGPKGLDRPLAPLWRGFPVYPQTLSAPAPAGRAEIEFIIDREGRARTPRILSATEEAFGWAAATAISQWVFERPTKAGEPVDVTVRVPVNFTPPKS